jgi:hypothetical protein
VGDISVDIEVRDNREMGRYEVDELDMTATLDYRPERRLVLARLHVPQSIDESATAWAGSCSAPRSHALGAKA